MSYSRRQLYAMGEPLGDGATRREAGGKIIYGGGGGGGGTPANTTQQVTQDLPEWARPYAKDSLAKAAALTSRPFQTYGGERIAQFAPMQRQAFGRAEGQQVADQVGFGSGLAGLAGTASFQDPGTAQGFMSPFMQNVVDRQMMSAQRQADIASTQRGAQAARAGAFGGSRQAIENAEAARALASQQGDIQARGLQSAFEQAQGQFNQEQATRLNAAQQLGQLGQQQFGQQMGITEQQSQFGAQQRAGTQDILSQQYQDFLNQQRAPFDDLAFMTSMIRGTPMGGTTARFQTQAPASPASQLAGLGTAAIGAYGASQGRAAGGTVNSYAAGGGISALNQPEMAAMAGGMSDEQLNEVGQMPSITELARMTLAAEAQQRAQMRQQATMQQAMMQQQPQGTVAEEQMQALGGISDLPAPNLEGMDEATMAGGGIIAFSTGDAVPRPYSALKFQDLEPYRAGAYFRSGDTRINPVTQEPISFADFMRLQQRERADAAAPAAQAIIQRELQANPRMAANFAATQKPEAVASAGIADILKQSAADTAKAPPTGSGRAPTPRTTAEPGLSSSRPPNDFFAKPRADIEALGREEKALAEQEAEAVRKDQEAVGVRGAERKTRIEEGLAGLAGKKDQNVNMALIEAGLAMMAGSSANAFENIGKGALVGTKAFTEGTERLNRERTRLDDKLAELEDLQFSDDKANRADLRKAQSAVKQAEIGTKKALASLGIKEAETVIDLYKNDRMLQNQRVVAGIAAGNAGRKFSELTPKDRADLEFRAADEWRNMPIQERSQITAAGTTREQWIAQRARSVIDGPKANADVSGFGKAQVVN